MATKEGRYPIAVVGAGALGRLFAAGLARVGPVVLVARNAERAAALMAGYTWVTPEGARRVRLPVAHPGALPEADWVVLVVKGPDTPAAARLAERMRPQGVLSLQNGLVEAALRRALPDRLVAQGVTTEGAYREGERVVWAGRGETLVPPGFEPIAQALARAGFRARVEPGIHEARLKKLLVNLVINPLTALARVENGRVAQPPLDALARRLIAEALPVLRGEGLELTPREAEALVFGVARDTARNRSSMLQDVLAGRPTELETLTGAFVALAERRGVAVPTHRALHALLRAWEQGQGE